MNYFIQTVALVAGIIAALLSHYISVHIALAYVTTTLILVIVDETEHKPSNE